MKLRDILQDRAAVNILKLLYDQEFVIKASYTSSSEEIMAKLGLNSQPTQSIALLSECKLIASEETDTGFILSLSKRGKEFIEQFDKMKDAFEGQVKKEVKAYKIEYSLTELEKRILLIASKIKKESSGPIPLKTLTEEVYPYKAPTTRVSTVSKYVNKLEKLNLMKKTKTQQGTFVEVTESGEKVIVNQELEKEV